MQQEKSPRTYGGVHFVATGKGVTSNQDVVLSTVLRPLTFHTKRTDRSCVGVNNVMGLGAGENLIRFYEADTRLFILDL